MVELPEAYVLARQLNETVKGKVIQNVTANASPHKFAWYTGDPGEYHSKLAGKRVISATPGTGYTCGGNTEILCGEMLLVISTPIRYHAPGDKLPAKHQLLIEFEDFSHLSCTVQMWGGMLCFPAAKPELPSFIDTGKCPSPLESCFDRVYYNSLLETADPKMSVKAFLATEQRIPGLGNGVLQDILYNARIHPKTKMNRLDGCQLDTLYSSIRTTLFEMAAKGGRDTERDLFGRPGGYKTFLSANTLGKPCPVCGGEIQREAYLGGNIYYCPGCQKPA